MPIASAVTSSLSHVLLSMFVSLLVSFGSDLHKRVIIAIAGDHVGIIIGVLLLGGVWLALVYLVVIVLVEWIRCTKAIEAITLPGHLLGGNLHEGVVIPIAGDHVGVIIRVLLLRGIWLALVNLVIIILVEWIRCTKAIEAITLPGHLLGGNLHEGVVIPIAGD